MMLKPRFLGGNGLRFAMHLYTCHGQKQKYVQKMCGYLDSIGPSIRVRKNGFQLF